MNSNHEQRVCFGSVSLSLSLSLPLVYAPRCVAGFGVRVVFPHFICATKQPLVPQEADSPTLLLQIYWDVSLYLMKGKTGYLLLMNLEYKKMHPLLKTARNCLYKAKWRLDGGQNLMKDP